MGVITRMVVTAVVTGTVITGPRLVQYPISYDITQTTQLTLSLFCTVIQLWATRGRRLGAGAIMIGRPHDTARVAVAVALPKIIEIGSVYSYTAQRF